ncbi:MAG: hypothetical protein Q9213_002103 [Squamulea squamosa]
MDDINPNPFTLQEVDEASAALILQLQQEDADELQRTSKGKGRENELSDADFAIQLFQQDLQQTSTLFNDRSMSRSLARAIIADAALLTDAVAREDTVANDRLVAEQLSHGGEIKSGKDVLSEDTQMDDLLLARLMALYVADLTVDGVPSFSDGDVSTIGPTAQDRHVLLLSRQIKSLVSERHVPYASHRPAQSVKATPMTAIVHRTPQRSKCLRQHWNRDGNGATIADG